MVLFSVSPSIERYLKTGVNSAIMAMVILKKQLEISRRPHALERAAARPPNG
jgi:hypothetical protein